MLYEMDMLYKIRSTIIKTSLRNFSLNVTKNYTVIYYRGQKNLTLELFQRNVFRHMGHVRRYF
jgi:hypothetical protein